MRGLRFGAAALGTASAIGMLGCTGSTETVTVPKGEPDVRAARQFKGYALYWVGQRFEGLELSHVSVIPKRGVIFSYGTCEIQLPADGGCGVPLSIQIEPACVEAAAVDSGRVIRGAPLNFSYGGDPILYTDRVRITVFAARGRDLRALRALRSVNEVPPVLDADDRIPAPRAKARRACPR